MLILLEINALNILNQCLYQNENPTFLPCQVGNTFLSNIFLRFSGCGYRIFFVGMAIFHIFLILEEQISVELLVENQKSCLFSSNFFQNIIYYKVNKYFMTKHITNLSHLERKLMKGLSETSPIPLPVWVY